MFQNLDNYLDSGSMSGMTLGRSAEWQIFFMLTKDQKKELVKDLTAKIKAAKAVVFADFRGLKVKDLSELKKELRKSDASFKVAKKTLMDIALKDAGLSYDTEKLEGQIALALSKDEVTAAKIIDTFSKKNENIKILGGIVNAKGMTDAEVKALAKLPGKPELLAKLVGTINAPVSGFVNVLAGNIRGLVQVLKAVADNKGI
jgi:large subunit ribosomal protein L10